MIGSLWRSLWSRLKKTVARWWRDDGSLLAASVAYYAVFSILPLLMILMSVLGFALEFSGSAQDAQSELLQVLAENTSPALSHHVGEVLSEIRTNAAFNGPLGVFFLVLAAIGVFSQFETAFDRIWNVQQPPSRGVVAAVCNALVLRLRAFLMLLAVAGLVLAAFLADIAMSAVGSMTKELPGGGLAWNVLQLSVSPPLYWLSFTVLYKTLPKPAVRWSDAAAGALLAMILWEVGRQVLIAFLIGERYNAYSAIGSMMIVLLWIYYASSLILLGAEYVQLLGEQRRSPDRRPHDQLEAHVVRS